MANLSKDRDAKLQGLPVYEPGGSQLPKVLAFFSLFSLSNQFHNGLGSYDKNYIWILKLYFIDKALSDNSKPVERRGRKATGPSGASAGWQPAAEGSFIYAQVSSVISISMHPRSYDARRSFRRRQCCGLDRHSRIGARDRRRSV